jgi:glycosyltransferase involved in cell wall biosynthesis
MTKRKKSLFIVDGSLDRPILHSQGIPLLKRLSQRGITCYIQSFESSVEASRGELGAELIRHNITWLPVVMDKTLSDWQRIRMVVGGFLEAYNLCRREKIDVVHCRSYRPGVMGSLIKTFTGNGFIFDMRGFLIDEQVMLGRWQPKGLKYHVARLLERWILLNADVTIANSPQFRTSVLELSRDTRPASVLSISNCVDTLRFVYPHPSRQKTRTELGWSERLVIAFAGEVRAWEDFDDICGFFEAIKNIHSSAFLAFFAYGNLADLHQVLETKGLKPEDYCLISVPPAQMPAYLGASDAGIIFRRENPFTKSAPSPIKFAEYLSCGLPVVLNPGIGDTGRLIEQHKVGVLIDPRKPEQLKSGAAKLLEMLNADPDLRQRCHETAQKELSLDMAQDQYFQVYQQVSAVVEKRAKR